MNLKSTLITAAACLFVTGFALGFIAATWYWEWRFDVMLGG